ncbi:MAG: hypothetical protein V1789_11690 [PVC group bacterium]
MSKGKTEKKISLWGVGHWGVRVAGSMPDEYRRRLKIVAVDSDVQSLICSPVADKLTLGWEEAAGRSAGGDGGKGEEAFRESASAIKEKLADCRVALIVGGLGGGTGSSLIPALCGTARGLKILTLALVTRPFAFEGKKKNLLFQRAREGIEKSGAGLACFSLDRLVGKAEDDTPHDEVFQRCDRILQEAVECVIDCLSPSPGSGCDGAALENILTAPGETVMGAYETAKPENLVAAAKGAFSALSLRPAELGRARGFLIQIEAAGPIPFRHVEQAVGAVSGRLAEDADLLYAVTRKKEAGDKIIVRIIAFGIPERGGEKIASAIPVTMTTDVRPAVQTEIDFKKLTRGVFADTGPTLLDGEDLDIPTFVRKGVELE